MTPEIMRQYLAAHAPELEVVELPEAHTSEYISREWKTPSASDAEILEVNVTVQAAKSGLRGVVFEVCQPGSFVCVSQKRNTTSCFLGFLPTLVQAECKQLKRQLHQPQRRSLDYQSIMPHPASRAA